MPGITIDAHELEDFAEELGRIPEIILSELDGTTGAQIREVMSSTAKMMAPVAKASRGGTLRQMIDSSDKGFSQRHEGGVRLGITSNADYSIYVEYGTGYRGDPKVPHTSKRVWFQYNPDYNPLFGEGDPRSQKFIRRTPQKARHFMEPALEDNIDNICDIIAGNIEEVFEQ